MIVTAGAGIGVAVGVGWSLFAAELRTRIEIDFVDARDQRIERALVAFEDEDGHVLSKVERADSRWLFVDAEPSEPDWGRAVARAQVRAFGCEREAAVEVEMETRGSRFGRLSPHPVPLTHTYVLRGEVRCPDPRTGSETGLPLARLVDDLSAGEPWSYAASSELIRIGAAAAPALTKLIAILRETPDRALRVGLVRALGAIGSAAAPAVPALMRVLEDPEPAIRRVAATALEGIGPDAPGVVTALAATARHEPDRHTQEHVIRILGRMGPEARAAEDFLVAILEDEAEEDAVRRAAFSALGHLKTESATAAQRRYAADHPILW